MPSLPWPNVAPAQLGRELAKRGHAVDWPVTGKLLLDGTELDVDDVLMQARDAGEAADAVEQMAE